MADNEPNDEQDSGQPSPDPQPPENVEIQGFSRRIQSEGGKGGEGEKGGEDDKGEGNEPPKKPPPTPDGPKLSLNRFGAEDVDPD